MIIFKAENNKTITDIDFRESLSNFNLSGKSVILFSRLFSFGRIQGEKAVYKIIEILQDCIGISNENIVFYFSLRMAIKFNPSLLA